MKLSNILLTVLFLFATALFIASGKVYNHSTFTLIGYLMIVPFICAANLLREDIQIANKRRKRRAMALRMTGYTQLRSGAWEKNAI